MHHPVESLLTIDHFPTTMEIPTEAIELQEKELQAHHTKDGSIKGFAPQDMADVRFARS